MTETSVSREETVKSNVWFGPLSELVRKFRHPTRDTLHFTEDKQRIEFLRVLTQIYTDTDFAPFGVIAAALGTKPGSKQQWVANSTLSELFRHGVLQGEIIYYEPFPPHWTKGAAKMVCDMNKAEREDATKKKNAAPGYVRPLKAEEPEAPKAPKDNAPPPVVTKKLRATRKKAKAALAETLNATAPAPALVQGTLPGIPAEAPPKAPRPEEPVAPEPVLPPHVRELFDPVRGVVVGSITGLAVTHYTEHWITAKNDQGAPVRLIVR